MQPDEWFRLWIALMTTFGGGMVTLTGVYLGGWLAARKIQTENGSRSTKWKAESSPIPSGYTATAPVPALDL